MRRKLPLSTERHWWKFISVCSKSSAIFHIYRLKKDIGINVIQSHCIFFVVEHFGVTWTEINNTVLGPQVRSGSCSCREKTEAKTIARTWLWGGGGWPTRPSSHTFSIEPQDLNGWMEGNKHIPYTACSRRVVLNFWVRENLQQSCFEKAHPEEPLA